MSPGIITFNPVWTNPPTGMKPLRTHTMRIRNYSDGSRAAIHNEAEPDSSSWTKFTPCISWITMALCCLCQISTSSSTIGRRFQGWSLTADSLVKTYYGSAREIWSRPEEPAHYRTEEYLLSATSKANRYKATRLYGAVRPLFADGPARVWLAPR